MTWGEYMRADRICRRAYYAQFCPCGAVLEYVRFKNALPYGYCPACRRWTHP